VRLDTGSVLDGCVQLVPDPAIAWDLKCAQSYAWRSPQHINVLELIAVLNYFRAWLCDGGNRSIRTLHVVDSRVVSCVIAKGRSSSIMLNRVLRRLAGLTLAADTYIVPVWTISAWNFSDDGSRAVARPNG
jgi:hypothetical protein